MIIVGLIFINSSVNAGNEVIKEKMAVVSGRTKTCGCLRKERMFELKQHKQLEAGTIFGWLVVENYIEYKNKRHFYNCKCKCGNNKIISSDRLKAGTSSCGCKKQRKNFDHQRFKSIPENTKINELTVLTFAGMRKK